MNTQLNASWNIDTSYLSLPEYFYSNVLPTPVQHPTLIVWNKALALSLGLDNVKDTDESKANCFSGNILPECFTPLAQAYAGHQFGHFNMLGDGRAHLLGEHVTADGKRVDIQLKGSGITPYGRRGDGRAALAPMLREYIMSEAMHALNIPTTRSLAVVSTGEPIFRETVLSGAVLTRIAQSHIRIGTFEYAAQCDDPQAVKTLADYVIARHYPALSQKENPYLALLHEVMHAQIELITHWLRVGFIHGVMNTDNVTISGETLDYGPCAFMDYYDPKTVFSSIDRAGRYAYANQPHITQWNLARFAETLLPLLHTDLHKAAQRAEEVIESFSSLFQKSWMKMMCNKLGIHEEHEQDAALIGEFLQWMQQFELDYTNSFKNLENASWVQDKCTKDERFASWHTKWDERRRSQKGNLEASYALMASHNPIIIPRNHHVEHALQQAQESGDLKVFHSLLDALATPYEHSKDKEHFMQPADKDAEPYRTFCGT